mmetsp:Transcript_2252/g.6443  ORF Transcript_2252/g.6443 Transcript_2252/m.6443 type:complete len:218 (-) Transcript_2252:726-1379(-)
MCRKVCLWIWESPLGDPRLMGSVWLAVRLPGEACGHIGNGHRPPPLTHARLPQSAGLCRPLGPHPLLWHCWSSASRLHRPPSQHPNRCLKKNSHSERWLTRGSRVMRTPRTTGRTRKTHWTTAPTVISEGRRFPENPVVLGWRCTGACKWRELRRRDPQVVALAARLRGAAVPLHLCTVPLLHENVVSRRGCLRRGWTRCFFVSPRSSASSMGCPRV